MPAPHTVWIVFSPGKLHTSKDVCFSAPLQAVERFIRQFGLVRAVQDSLTLYRFEHETEARRDAAARCGTVSCSFCNGVAHPATGCVYGERMIACRDCACNFWKWVKEHTNKKARRPKDGRILPNVNFYEAAGKDVRASERREIYIGAPLPILDNPIHYFKGP